MRMLCSFELHLNSKWRNVLSQYGTRYSLSVPHEAVQAILSPVPLKISQRNDAWRLLRSASTNTTAADSSNEQEKNYTEKITDTVLIYSVILCAKKSCSAVLLLKVGSNEDGN